MNKLIIAILGGALVAATVNLTFAMDSNPLKECSAEVQERIAGYKKIGFSDYQISEVIVADAYDGKEFTVCLMPDDPYDASATTYATCGEKKCTAKYKGRFAHVKNVKPQN